MLWSWGFASWGTCQRYHLKLKWGILDQTCKMGVTKHQDLTSLTRNLKGFGTNLLSCEPWLLMPASRAGEGRVASAAQAFRKGFRHHLGGGRCLSLTSPVKKSDTVIISKLVITFECDTMIVSFAPAEEGNNELQSPGVFWKPSVTVAARGCNWQVYLLVIQAGDHPHTSPAPTLWFPFMESKHKQIPILPRQGGMTQHLPPGLSWGKFTGPSKWSTVLVTEGWGESLLIQSLEGRKQNQKNPTKH